MAAAPTPFQQLTALGKASPSATGVANFAPLIGASLNDSQTNSGAALGSKFSPTDYFSALPGGSGSGSGSTDLSAFNQGIDSTNVQLNNLTPQLGVGLQSNANNYQTTVNGLNTGKAQTDQTYNTDKTNAGQDFVTAKNQINTNTGNTISSLSRLLGSRGAAGSSAGDYAALLAAGQGTQERAGAATNFAKNEQSLDQNYNNYVATYNQNLQNAGLQKTQADNQTRSAYDTNRANLLQSLASLVNQRTAASGGTGTAASQPYSTEANNLLAEASGLNTPTPVAAQLDNKYVAPSLASYTTNPTALGVGSNAGAAAQSTIPFTTLLTNRDKSLAGA